MGAWAMDISASRYRVF